MRKAHIHEIDTWKHETGAGVVCLVSFQSGIKLGTNIEETVVHGESLNHSFSLFKSLL